jgi:hypothetical protein
VTATPVNTLTTLSRVRAARQSLAVAALAAIGTMYVSKVDPNQAGHYPTCPFRYLTGYACPGCGSLRAVHDLATGHPLDALHRNPLTVLVIPVAVVALLGWIRREATGRPIVWSVPIWLLWTFLGAVLTFWLFRNLPGFGWLGP